MYPSAVFDSSLKGYNPESMQNKSSQDVIAIDYLVNVLPGDTVTFEGLCFLVSFQGRGGSAAGAWRRARLNCDAGSDLLTMKENVLVNTIYLEHILYKNLCLGVHKG